MNCTNAMQETEKLRTKRPKKGFAFGSNPRYSEVQERRCADTPRSKASFAFSISIMAYDEGLAQIMRDTLSRTCGVTEKTMFGGLCFLLNGNMLCGVHGQGGMARVGKANESRALEIEGVTPLAFTGRPMGGFVDLDLDALTDDERRNHVIGLALDYVNALPAK